MLRRVRPRRHVHVWRCASAAGHRRWHRDRELRRVRGLLRGRRVRAVECQNQRAVRRQRRRLQRVQPRRPSAPTASACRAAQAAAATAARPARRVAATATTSASPATPRRTAAPEAPTATSAWRRSRPACFGSCARRPSGGGSGGGGVEEAEQAVARPGCATLSLSGATVSAPVDTNVTIAAKRVGAPRRRPGHLRAVVATDGRTAPHRGLRHQLAVARLHRLRHVLRDVHHRPRRHVPRGELHRPRLLRAVGLLDHHRRQRDEPRRHRRLDAQPDARGVELHRPTCPRPRARASRCPPAPST